MVSYPGACGEPAVGEGWGCLPLCESHWQEAEMAAREELARAVADELRVLALAEVERIAGNAAVAAALSGARVPGPGWEREDGERYEEALAAAFPIGGLDEGLTDPITASYDYRRHDFDGPEEWWTDERLLLLRFLRQAGGAGLPPLVEELERMREKATVQLALAERDFERRWAGLPREERERLARGAVAEAEESAAD